MSCREFCRHECSNIQPELCQKLPKSISSCATYTFNQMSEAVCVRLCTFDTVWIRKNPPKSQTCAPDSCD